MIVGNRKDAGSFRYPRVLLERRSEGLCGNSSVETPLFTELSRIRNALEVSQYKLFTSLLFIYAT